MRSKRKFLFYGLVICFQLLLAEGILQGYYRLTAGDWLFNRVGLPIFEQDDHRYYRVKSNLNFRHATNEFEVYYFTDENGLRSDEERSAIKPAKDPDVYRILFTGPSFAFGIAGNYEDIYVTRIAEQLSLENKRVEVINLGTPGQPPGYQLCWIRDAAASFAPDMVVQTVYGDPALLATECSQPSKPFVFVDGYLIRENWTLVRNITSKVKQSAIVFYSWFLYQIISSSERGDEGMGTEFYEDEKLVSGAAPDVVVDTYSEYGRYVRSALGPDIEIAFVHIPYSYVVRPADVVRWSHLDALDPSGSRRKAHLLDVAVNEAGMNFINPLDELIDRDQRERTYYFLNIHFTPAGNEVVADVAAPVIQTLIETHEARRRQLAADRDDPSRLAVAR